MKVTFKKEDDRYHIYSYDDKLKSDFSEQEKEWFHKCYWFFITSEEYCYKHLYYDLCVTLSLKFRHGYGELAKSHATAKVCLAHSEIEVIFI